MQILIQIDASSVLLQDMIFVRTKLNDLSNVQRLQ